MTRGPRPGPLLLVWMVTLSILASPALAQFNPNQPETVGIIVLPFEPERESDASVALLLEDYVANKLPRKVKQPLTLGAEARPGIKGSPASCLKDATCLRKLGAAFQASLVASVTVGRAGPDMKVVVAWYSTANGIRLGRDELVVAAGDENQLVDGLQRSIGTYFPASLKLSPGALAGEGGVVGDSDQDDRAAEYKAAREKRVSSRREDFGSADDGPPAEEDDRLKATAERERSGGQSSTPRPRPSEREADGREGGGSETVAEPRERESSGSGGSRDGRSAREERPETTAERRPDSGSPAEPEDEGELPDEEEADLDAIEEEASEVERPSARRTSERAADLAVAEESARAGFGNREKERFARSGLGLDPYLQRRWAYGKRVHLRIFGAYGAGYLTRRYATIVFIRAGNVQTEEYYYESLGASFIHPGGGIGFSVAPVDLVEFGADLTVLYAQQGLRREYVGHDFGTSVCSVDNCPPEAQPQHQGTAHVIIDAGARFLLPPLSRVKFVPGVLFTTVLMQGYSIQPQPPITYSDRPLAGVVGLSPTVGLRANLSPFVSLFLDVPITILLSHGAAKAQEHRLESGVTEGYLEEQYMEVPPATGNIMVRAQLGVILHF